MAPVISLLTKASPDAFIMKETCSSGGPLPLEGGGDAKGGTTGAIGVGLQQEGQGVLANKRQVSSGRGAMMTSC